MPYPDTCSDLKLVESNGVTPVHFKSIWMISGENHKISIEVISGIILVFPMQYHLPQLLHV